MYYTILNLKNPSVPPELRIECPIGYQALAVFSAPLSSGETTCEFFEAESSVEVICCIITFKKGLFLLMLFC